MIRNNLSQLLFFLIGTLALIALCLYLARRFRKQMNPYREKLEALAKTLPEIPCKLSSFIDAEPSLIGHWSELKFTLRYCGGDFCSLPLCLRLRLNIRPSINFTIYSNYKGSSKVLFLKKVYTDEVDLDKYDFYSNKPDEAKKYLLSHHVVLSKLSEGGWEMPVFNQRSISIYTDVNSSFDAETIKSTLQNLNQLAN